ncbi:hypothetical protein NIES4075_52250 [Tolypothrix sp. NIES-4075]|uniref:lasso peptide n=1 Tax=Tolypothrix sp. NIES-4075 TaxID=2005459 RepID=UPI000B5D07E4|nr:lasso peptide [Tolypothrix sp. NIES-4075]GAX44208.1 hypothetical protein NIES4075_52250 [Tolypothrix sp. NIES-4075]
MKQTYNTPKMIVHGNLAELTQVSGRNAIRDTLFFNGQPTNVQSDDSLDLLTTSNGSPTTRPAGQ